MSSDSDNEPIETTSDVTPASTKASPPSEKEIELPKFEKGLADKIVRSEDVV